MSLRKLFKANSKGGVAAVYCEDKSMKKIVLYLLLVLIIVFIVIQFVPVERTNQPVVSDIPASPEVKAVLKGACYDCHSNETVWPWYSKVAPVSWLIAQDVYEGREYLNFSIWDEYNTQKKAELVEESWEEVSEKEMPPWKYVILHPGARISKEDTKVLKNWILSSIPKKNLSDITDEMRKKHGDDDD